MRIRIIKDSKDYKKNEIVEVSKNVAFGLIDSGIGMISKDMAPDDYKQAGDKDGKPTKLRTHQFGRR